MRKKGVKRRKNIFKRIIHLTLAFSFIFLSMRLLFSNYLVKYKEVEALAMSKENSVLIEKEVNEIKKEINEIKEELNEMKKDNSGYLSLSEDPNADDASIILPETMYKWNFYRNDNRKIAYLTFDDGPSEKVTNKILDILKENDIKATFFSLGTAIENNKSSFNVLKRIAKEGHAIGSHGYSHNYNLLYPEGRVDINAILEDLEKNDKLLKSILGKDFSTRLIRLPGGYSSWYGTKELDTILKEKNIWQVDWNSLNGDAEGKDLNKNQMLNRLKETALDQDVLIILMHDTDNKNETVNYLQDAIDYLKSEGFEFRTLK